MATGAAEGLLQCVLEGCISGSAMDIERRPYHRNCGCALHKSGGGCSNSSHRNTKISYPMRRAWSESCLVLAASSNCSSPSSLANEILLGVERTQLNLSKEQ
ncbi:hypothetical protein HHK36_021328 [Tetracentron sinense]|uniref:Uncharacterized protein n=1 Tax=Tetracentron sinense TaxID=13715 RepID=A0A834YRB0_TETSI|nr:hypothetical protein HHK36_021328 [Tetracentron sinense]